MLFILLVIGLGSVYMVTYSGRIEIADQMQYFDVTSSIAMFGDMKRDQAMWERMPFEFSRRIAEPFRDSLVEPGLMIAAAPLYWLAEQLNGIGLVHTTYLFNVGVSALVCGLWFWIALLLGYRERTALFGAICLGLGTIMLPYSQTFFREPLMMAQVLVVVLVIEWGRIHFNQSHWARRAILVVAVVILIFAAFRTKEAVILLLPALPLLLTPEKWWRNRIASALLIALLVLPVLIVYTDLLTLISPRLQNLRFGPFTLETGYTQTALHTYLFSLGGSLWGTSPLLLLAIPGGWWLWKNGQRRVVMVAVTVILSFTLGYSLLRGEEWFGGTIWPQRFLLPALPFAMLLLLPVLDRLMYKTASTENVEAGAAPRPYNGRNWLWLIFGLLMLYSLWWQVMGVAFRWDEYSRVTYDLSFGGLAYWGPGFNDPRYIRPTMLTPLLGQIELNFAWVRTGAWGVPLEFGGLVVVCLLLVRWLLRKDIFEPQRHREHRVLKAVILILPVIFALATYLTLRTIYIDPAYEGDNPALHEMLSIIQTDVPQGETLMLADREYNYFFLNYGKTGKTRVVGFPFHPGDRGSCDQELRVESDNPDVLLEPGTAPVIYHLAAQYPRLWLLMSSGQDIPCVVRPMERFMGQHYYRVSEKATSPAVRLLSYQTSDAPDPYAFRGADQAVDLHYADLDGASIDLIGLTLPDGLTYQAGDWLPVSLYWRSDAMLTRVYTVAWFVADSGGWKAQGEDTWHGATFSPTTLWTPGLPSWDHRALRLPDDLPPGEYQLWVKVYWRDPATGAITDLTVSGAETQGENIGVLPIRITVE